MGQVLIPFIININIDFIYKIGSHSLSVINILYLLSLLFLPES